MYPLLQIRSTIRPTFRWPDRFQRGKPEFDYQAQMAMVSSRDCHSGLISHVNLQYMCNQNKHIVPTKIRTKCHITSTLYSMGPRGTTRLDIYESTPAQCSTQLGTSKRITELNVQVRKLATASTVHTDMWLATHRRDDNNGRYHYHLEDSLHVHTAVPGSMTPNICHFAHWKNQESRITGCLCNKKVPEDHKADFIV